MAARKNIRKRNKNLKTNTNTIMFIILGLFTIVFIGAIILSQPKGSAVATDEILGEVIPIDSAEHVDPGTDPGPYASSPPAGGKHYAEDWEAGFYDESSPETTVPFPQGYLVHNLEHGYVIFWYNCAASSDCSVLKQQIRTVMNEFSNVKLIAFPWSDMDYPLAMASWGRLLRFEAINLDVMRAFVRNNRNQAPEPNMP